MSGFASWTRLLRRQRLAPVARDLQTMDRLFGTTLATAGEPNTVGQLLDRRVDVVWQAHNEGNPAAARLLRVAAGAERFDEAIAEGLTFDDVRRAIAIEHGFADWAAVAPHRDQPVDPNFEMAVGAIVSGDLATLRTLLNTHPALSQARSPFGHHATLVHYVAANGVEASRQWQSPRNAVKVLRLLLRHGGDPDALCDSYGGGSAMTPLYLLVSSRHPADAGVQPGLVEELCRGGANPNGHDEDGVPSWTAITFGYPDAVEALVRGGAWVDNLVFAAAADDLPKVKEYVRQQPTDQPRSVQRIGIHGPRLDPDRLIEYALIYAAGLGRRAVVEFLLTCDPDLSVIEPKFHSTAAGMARYQHRNDILALLENE